MIKAALCFTSLLASGISTVTAQLISIRTVPVSQAHQFEIFPSRTIAMGGVSIAVADSLMDPFVNPAKAARLSDTRFFGSPSTYSVSSGSGGGRTLPVGALTRRDSWYGGVWAAIQQVDLNPQATFPPGIIAGCPTCDVVNIDPTPSEPQERSEGNVYAFGLLGKSLGNGVSVGGSLLWSRLKAIDGVDLLYSGSTDVDQFGHSLDARFGVLKEWADQRSLEAIVLHNRFATTHDVHFLDSFWDPAKQQVMFRPRLEKNLDRTNTWGLHVEYEVPLSASGWRVGVIGTVNRMDHPKIPNYSIMNIPRDPGHSSAFNVGFGLSRELAESTFGIELIYEPIWSHTWADAESAIESITGRKIPAGGMTIENHFRFSNLQARIGVDQGFTLGRTGPAGGLQLGLAVRGNRYWLDQHDHVQVTDRQHDERWTEWTPTWGLSLRFPELEVRYRGSMTHGTGRPFVQTNGGVWAVRDLASVGTNILAAPSGAVSLDEVRVMTHQISISLPVR